MDILRLLQCQAEHLCVQPTGKALKQRMLFPMELRNCHVRSGFNRLDQWKNSSCVMLPIIIHIHQYITLHIAQRSHLCSRLTKVFGQFYSYDSRILPAKRLNCLKRCILIRRTVIHQYQLIFIFLME